jgi:hypothetical protein
MNPLAADIRLRILVPQPRSSNDDVAYIGRAFCAASRSGSTAELGLRFRRVCMTAVRALSTARRDISGFHVTSRTVGPWRGSQPELRLSAMGPPSPGISCGGSWSAPHARLGPAIRALCSNGPCNAAAQWAYQDATDPTRPRRRRRAASVAKAPISSRPPAGSGTTAAS